MYPHHFSVCVKQGHRRAFSGGLDHRGIVKKAFWGHFRAFFSPRIAKSLQFGGFSGFYTVFSDFHASEAQDRNGRKNGTPMLQKGVWGHIRIGAVKGRNMRDWHLLDNIKKIKKNKKK